MPQTIKLPSKVKALLSSDKTYNLIKGGRGGGKTKTAVILSTLFAFQYPNTDQIYCRASYGSMADSCFAEYKDALESLPNGLGNEFSERHSPLRFDRGNLNKIYFMGIGGSNLDRTKGFKPDHPIKVVVMEETQELPSRLHFDQTLASLRRNFGKDAKVLILGNPPPQKAHWFNQLAEEKAKDRDWLELELTWEDITPFLNDYDIKEILKCKYTNREYYEWFYMGHPSASLGSVYIMYNEKRHKYTLDEVRHFMEIKGVRPVGCVIGGDGAVTRDCTAFVPLIIMSNGQSFVGPIFHHDPTIDGVFGSQRLAQDYLQQWFDELCKSWSFGTREEIVKTPYLRQTPILMVIDEASADLRQACNYFFSMRSLVKPIKKSRIPQMVAVVQSAISNDMVNIIDYGGYYDYVRKVWVKAQNPLDYQLQNLIWNDNGTGYDPALPNDDCDAFTYAVNAWYGRIENMQWFNIRTSSEKIYDFMRNAKEAK